MSIPPGQAKQAVADANQDQAAPPANAPCPKIPEMETEGYDFGDRPLGKQSYDGYIVVRSVGTKALSIVSIAVESRNSDLIKADLRANWLPLPPVPGPLIAREMRVPVHFTPRARGDTPAKELLLKVTAREVPPQIVPVTGKVVAPVLQVTGVVDLAGEVEAGGTLSGNITVANTGDAPLQIKSITMHTNDARKTPVNKPFSWSLKGPFELGTGASRQVEIRLPRDKALAKTTCILKVDSNAPVNAVQEAPVTGEIYAWIELHVKDERGAAIGLANLKLKQHSGTEINKDTDASSEKRVGDLHEIDGPVHVLILATEPFCEVVGVEPP